MGIRYGSSSQVGASTKTLHSRPRSAHVCRCGSQIRVPHDLRVRLDLDYDYPILPESGERRDVVRRSASVTSAMTGARGTGFGVASFPSEVYNRQYHRSRRLQTPGLQSGFLTVNGEAWRG
jgi:hypothetical protein